jgi:hypothetical protein
VDREGAAKLNLCRRPGRLFHCLGDQPYQTGAWSSRRRGLRQRGWKGQSDDAASVYADPSIRYLLLQLQPALGPASQSVRLARLDIATGQVAYLRAPWIGSGAGTAW